MLLVVAQKKERSVTPHACHDLCGDDAGVCGVACRVVA